MNDICIVILAAGAGSRMKSNTPKVLFNICGLSMIEHILNKSYSISNDVNVVLYHQEELIKQHLKEKYKDLKFFTQDHEQFPGTAGALKNLDFNAKKVIVLCGDMPLITKDDILKLANSNADVSISAFNARDPFGYGRVILKDSKVLGIIEQKDATKEQESISLVNAGCYSFNAEALKKILPLIDNNNAQKEFYITDAVKIANELGFKCDVVSVNESDFMGVNDKFQLSIAEEIMQDKIKQDLMKEGILMRMPKSIYIDARAKFINECILEENVSIIGDCVIENSIIKSSSVVESSNIKNSTIGPLAHIRPNSTLQNSKIGNFVEIKSSSLNGVKAGHLSYLGDCLIDDGTNIGCGTITCNYDGKAKHKTKIGKNVFVGSNVKFIAPVEICDDVMIAAGSVITRNIQSGSLAIARSKQVNKDGFFYKFFNDKAKV